MCRWWRTRRLRLRRSRLQTESGEPVHFEGMLARKHEWESTTKKSSSRSWDKVYAVLHNKKLSFYKDQKHAKADPGNTYHNEPAIELDSASFGAATDYHKRAHVLRLKMTNGAEYLLQCKDDDEMNVWLNKLNLTIGDQEAQSPGRAQTLPAKTDEAKSGEQKKRSFFTLGKKK